jgi:hypothetical protein
MGSTRTKKSGSEAGWVVKGEWSFAGRLVSAHKRTARSAVERYCMPTCYYTTLIRSAHQSQGVASKENMETF